MREAEGRERVVAPERPVDDRQSPPQSPPGPPRRGRGGSGGGYDGLPKRKRRLGWLWALITLLVLALIAGGVALFAWTNYETQVREVFGWQLPIDYEGDGNGEAVNVVIKDGDIGQDIADTLYDAGVTMTSQAFYDLLVEEEPTFMPGTYALQKEMSARAALTALQDPANSVVASALIIEGTTLPTALQNLADGTGIPLADFEAASTDLASFGLPAEAPSLEGYLFPATYEFEPDQTAHDVLQRLVTETFNRLDARGVAVADRHHVLTMAGLIQKEGGPEADFPKVARVFQNRIDQGMRLQSDATVSYGAGSTSIFTTDAERADASNPYNTYANDGLPVGPISAPGDAAVDAALNPVDGPWLYFVLVNGETGETVFSTTNAEHDAAVEVWQQWLRDNPDWDTGE
nr:endolytic transglycosylase MltG [Conyzicola lurida]